MQVRNAKLFITFIGFKRLKRVGERQTTLIVGVFYVAVEFNRPSLAGLFPAFD